MPNNDQLLSFAKKQLDGYVGPVGEPQIIAYVPFTQAEDQRGSDGEPTVREAAELQRDNLLLRNFAQQVQNMSRTAVTRDNLVPTYLGLAPDQRNAVLQNVARKTPVIICHEEGSDMYIPIKDGSTVYVQGHGNDQDSSIASSSEDELSAEDLVERMQEDLLNDQGEKAALGKIKLESCGSGGALVNAVFKLTSKNETYKNAEVHGYGGQEMDEVVSLPLQHALSNLTPVDGAKTGNRFVTNSKLAEPSVVKAQEREHELLTNELIDAENLVFSTKDEYERFLDADRDEIHRQAGLPPSEDRRKFDRAVELEEAYDQAKKAVNSIKDRLINLEAHIDTNPDPRLARAGSHKTVLTVKEQMQQQNAASHAPLGSSLSSSQHSVGNVTGIAISTTSSSSSSNASLNSSTNSNSSSSSHGQPSKKSKKPGCNIQ